MIRKPFRVSIAAPRGTAVATVRLTDDEADTVRFALEEVVRAAEDGALDGATVEEIV